MSTVLADPPRSSEEPPERAALPTARTMTEADLSWNDIATRVEAAIIQTYRTNQDPDNDGDIDGALFPDANGQMCCDLRVVAMYPDSAVFQLAGRPDSGGAGSLFRVSYQIRGEDVTLGPPTEVIATYDPITESVRPTAPLTEAALAAHEMAGSQGRSWDVMLIQTGTSKNGYYYAPDVLRAAVPLFEGVPAFLDHDTPAEAAARPARSVMDKVGVFHNPTYGSFDVRGMIVEGIAARFKVVNDQVRRLLLEAVQAGEPDFYQFSINAFHGGLTDTQVNGRKVQAVTRLTKVRSVDIVTEASAGGTMLRLVESTGSGADTMDADQLKALLAEASKAGAEAALKAIKEATIPAAPSPVPAVDLSSIQTEIATLKEERRIASGVEAIEKAIAGATGLSEIGKGRVRQNLMLILERRTPAADEIQTVLQEQISYEAAFTAAILPTPGAPGQVREALRLGDSERNRFSKALTGFFEGQNVDGIKRFRTLQEAYCHWTGTNYFDLDMYEFVNAFSGGYDSHLNHKQIQESVTTASWSNTFADHLYVQMMKAYRANPLYNLWKIIVSEVEDVPDFQTRHWTRVGGYADLSTVNEQATYPQLTSFSDEEVSYSISKKGGIDDATIEMLTYERGAQRIRSIPTAMGRAAARTLYKFVLGLATTTNPTMDYDSTALYHANHSNTGTTALSVAGVATTEAAMRAQTAYGETSEILGLRNRIKTVIVPNTLEQRALRIFNPSQGAAYYIAATDDTNTSADPDAYKTRGINVLVYDQLTDATDWFAVADPNEVNTIVMGFWNGMQDPELFIQDSPNVGSVFNADKISWKVRHVYGGDVLDHRSFYRQVVAG